MTANLEPYPACKPSDVEWLGDVPAHWAVRRLKTHVDNIIDLTTGPGDADISLALEHVDSWTGKYRDAGPDVNFDSQVKRFEPDDVLFCKLRPYLAKVARPNRTGVCVGEFLVLRPSDEIMTPYYLEQLLRSKPIITTINASTFGAKMPRADWQFIGSLAIPVPPLPEQIAIARYLYYTDQRICRYLSAKQNLISLLEEDRQAVVSRAVTRGLDPGASLKPSGVEWLGDVPEHWKVRRLRTVAEMRVSNVDKHTREGEVPVRLCNYVDVYKNDRITQDLPFMSATASPDEIERFRLRRDDVLITKDSEAWDDIGVPALVTESADDLLSGYHLALLRPCKGILGAYLALTLQSQGVAYQFHAGANGVTRYGLTHFGIKSVLIPLPPLPEQNAIVAYLGKATADIDTAIARARLQVELLSEYRARLIADVVTGKLDVRGAAAKLPDVDPVSTDETEPSINAVVETGREATPVPQAAAHRGEVSGMQEHEDPGVRAERRTI